MKNKGQDGAFDADHDADLSDLGIESIDHTGILVASISALIMIVLGILTADAEYIFSYLNK